MAKPIDDIVKEQIAENILREDFFAKNKVPSANELEAKVDEFLEIHPDLTIPLTSKEDILVDEFEESSVIKFNTSMKSLQQDLASVYKALFNLTKCSMQDFDRYTAEIKLLNNRLIDLESRTSGLLLVAQDVEGLISFVEDNFVDFEKIDQSITTAEIDAESRIVKLPDSSSTSQFTKVNLNGIREQDVRFSILTKKFLSSNLTAPGSQLRNAFLDEQKVWQNRVSMTSQAEPVTTELVAQIASTPIDISKITFTLFSSSASSPITFNVQYSVDGYNYFPLPTESFIQNADEIAFWSFPSIKMKFIKFIMSKSGPDGDVEGLFIYEFGAKNISFFSQTYDTEFEAVFQSQPRFIFDSSDNLLFFNKVSLEVCENIPDDTSIDYQISIDKGRSFFDIAPINREQPLAATVVDLGGITESNNTNVLIDIDNQIIPQLSFTNAEDRAIRTKNDGTTPVIAGSDQVIESTIRVFRNIGSKGNADAVREIETGWRFEDPFYISTIVVQNPEGIVIDLGDFEATLGGTTVKGSTFIAEGVHKFVTHKNNWLPIDLVALQSATTVEDLKVLDRLYPFNHKLLIEGLNYISTFTGERTYQGMDIYTEFLMDRVSPFDLRNNVLSNDYSKFAIDIDSTTNKFLLIKINNEIGDSSNEKFIINYNIGDSEFGEIILKATLRTTNAGLTPLFSQYRLRLST